ncbi:MAG: hypothetical protein PWQ55_912 [Chloroflexota bacterium]|nr:hypothetical protein [Chloroflexota bacterium]
MTDIKFNIFAYRTTPSDVDRLKTYFDPETSDTVVWHSIRKPGSIQLKSEGDAALLMVDLGRALEDGIRFIAEVRDDHPNLPVLVFCAEPPTCREALEQAHIQNCSVIPVGDFPFAAQMIRMALENAHLRQLAQESENRFSQIFHDNPAPMLITQIKDGLIVDVNATFTELMGYTREEMLGNSVLDLGIWADPNDRKLMRKLLDKNGEVNNLEVKYHNKSDETRYLITSIEVIQRDNKPYLLSAALDITQRKRYENELVESRSKYSMAQKMAHLGSWSYDIRTKTVHWTDELYRIYGVDPDGDVDIVAEFYNRIHPDDREWVRAVNDQIQQDGKAFDIEFRLIMEDGSLRHIREITVAFRDEQGKLAALFGTDQDITEHKYLQWQLGERLKEMTCVSKAGQLLVDSGLTPQGVFQQLVDSLPPAMQFPEVAAGRVEVVGTVYTSANWDDASPYQLSAAIMTENKKVGSIAVAYTEEKPFILPEEQNLVDNLARMVGLWVEHKRSLEALNLSEQQYHSALESMLEGIQILDFDWHYVYINSAAEVHNRRPRSEMIGKTYTQIWPGIEDSEVYHLIENCLVERQPSRMENEFVFPDGTVGWFELSIEPTQTGVLIHSVDVTENKRAEGELKNQYEQREHYLTLLEMLTRFSTRIINLDIHKIDDEINAILRDLGEFENVDRVYIFQLNDSEMTNTHEWCAQGIDPQIENLQQIPTSTFPWWMKKLEKNEVIHISDIREMPESSSVEREFLEAQDIQSLLVVPLTAKNRLLGFMGFDAVNASRIWSSDTILLMQVAGDIMANAIQHRETEAALRQSNANYELVTQNSDDIIWVLDVQTEKFDYISPSIEKLRNFSVAEAMEQPLDQVLTPDSYSLTENIFNEVITHPENRKYQFPLTLELEQTRKDGSTVLTETVANIVNNDQGHMRIIGVSRDISQRKLVENQLRASEERFRQIADNIQEMFWMVEGSENKVIYLNPASEKIWGLPIKASYENPKLYLESILPEDQHIMVDAMARQAQGESLEMEFRIRHPDGSIHWIHERSFPIFDTQGQMIRTAGVASDITERKNTEEQMRQRADDLELFHKINEAKNRGDELIEIIHMMSANLQRMFGCTAVLTCLPDEEGENLLISNWEMDSQLKKRVEKITGNSLEKLPMRIPLSGKGSFARIARSGKAEIISNTTDIRAIMKEFTPNPVIRKFIPPVYRLLGIKSIALIPLVAQNKLMGFLNLNRVSEFSPVDLERVEGIAQQFITAVIRRKIESDLKLSEEKYRGLIESLDNVVATVDEEGRFLYMNDVAARSLGGTQEELIGKKVTELFGKPYADKQMESVLQVFREDRAFVLESPVSINGETEWFRTSLQPIHDANGKVVNVLINALNINELKKTQQELMELNRTLEQRVEERTAEVRDLYDNAPAGYHSLDAQGKILMINQTELDWLGYQRDEILGRSMTDFLTPTSLQKFKETFPLYKQRGWLRDQELEFMRKDGSILQGLVSATAIKDEEGNHVMSRSTIVDISERKKAQEALKESQAHLQDFLDSANDLIQTVDDQCRFTYVNKAWCDTLGYSCDEALQMSMYDIIEPSSYAHCQAILSSLKQDQEPLCIEVIFRTKEGQVVYVEGSVVAHREKDGSTLVNGIFRDVTQRRKAEQALRNSRDELRSANIALEKSAQLKDEFLASMSHELRTPLTGVLGLSEALQLETYGPLTENQHKALKDIESSGRHLLELINDILDLSKIEAEKLDLQVEPCSVTEICQASLQLVKGMAQKKHQKIEFKTNLADAVIQADPRRMKQMLVNLLSNAVKFTPEGGSLGLDVEGVEELNTLEFSVWDKGIGIKTEDLKRLFTPFVQLDSSLSRQQSGTGLGLSLVMRLAELHGGSVSVESEIGEGSTFRISLPWYPEKQEEPEEEVQVNQPVSISRCLLIEDNTIHCKQIENYLKQLNIECVAYHSGNGAFETAIRTHPDVIMLDLHLPDKSGEEVLKELKKDPRTSQIVVIISSVEDDRKYYLAQGAAGYLVKPFTLEDVQKEFARVFNLLDNETEFSSEQNGTITVLVVDDNQIVLDTVTDFLKTRAYYVVQAHSGQEMVDLTPRINPDIILADIQMPGMDGLEAIRRVRALHDEASAAVPIIAVTALAMMGDREKCIEAGANDYLSKPIKLVELEERIKAVIVDAERQRKEDGSE